MNALRSLMFAAALAAPWTAHAQAPTDNDSIRIEPAPEWSLPRMREAVMVELPRETGLKPPVLPALPAPPQAGGFGVAVDPGDDPRKRMEQAAGDPQVTPLKYGGKLFFVKPGEGNYLCSGQFIAPNVVLTAAHCVRNNSGQWYSDFRFAQQYHHGKYSRQFGARCVATKRGWVSETGRLMVRVPREFDYAMMLVDGASTSGHFGYQYGWKGMFEKAVKIGYPVEISGGHVIQVEPGPIFLPEDRPGLIAIRHNVPASGGGSSGGGFIGNYSSNGQDEKANRVISVTSASYGDDVNTDVGPYFDEGFKSLLEHVLAGCPS